MKSWLRSELSTLLKVESRQGITVKLREKRIPEEKLRIVEETKELLRKYRTIALLDLSNTPSKVLTYLRKAVEGKAIVKLIKNTLLERAIDELKLPNADELKKYLTGQNIAIFTNMNAFELKMLLDKVEVPVKAKPGVTLDREIVIPPMRTELKPGPIMSLFGRFRIPVQVREGVLWIAKEVTIAKPGDVVTPELVSLFEKLGIEPVLLKPKIKLAYEEGLVIPADKLVIDIEATRNDILKGVIEALNIASELVLPEPEVVKLSIRKAFARASRLASETGFVTPETAEIVIRDAISRAQVLAVTLASKSSELAQMLQVEISVAQPPSVSQPEKPSEEKKEEEEKKEVSEEQLAEGLAALFG